MTRIYHVQLISWTHDNESLLKLLQNGETTVSIPFWWTTISSSWCLRISAVAHGGWQPARINNQQACLWVTTNVFDSGCGSLFQLHTKLGGCEAPRTVVEDDNQQSSVTMGTVWTNHHKFYIFSSVVLHTRATGSANWPSIICGDAEQPMRMLAKNLIALRTGIRHVPTPRGGYGHPTSMRIHYLNMNSYLVGA